MPAVHYLGIQCDDVVVRVIEATARDPIQVRARQRVRLEVGEVYDTYSPVVMS